MALTDPVHRYSVIVIREDGRNATEHDRIHARTLAGALFTALTEPKLRAVLERPGEPEGSVSVVIARHGKDE